MGVWQIYGEEIKQLRDQGHSLEGIGNKLNVSRERVRQILNHHYGTTAVTAIFSRAEIARLIGCLQERLVTLERKGLVKPTHIDGRFLYNREESEKAMLEIAKKKVKVTPAKTICEECGEIKYIKPYRIRSNSPHRFCSRRCHGKFVGRTYGFRVHGKCNKGSKKWDYDKICRLWEEENKSVSEISVMLKIPRASVYYILRQSFGRLQGLRKPPRIQSDTKECIGCGTIHTRRSLFCSMKCYDRIRALVKYYEGWYLGSQTKKRAIKEAREKISDE